MPTNIPYYAVNEPYELYYKNETAAFPVGAHTHNAAELYFTLTDLPDVLLNDTISQVSRGTLIIIPPFCVHQLYHEPNVRYERFIFNIDVRWLENALCSEQELIHYLKHSDAPLILPLPSELVSQLAEAMTKALPIVREKSIKSTAEFFTLLSRIDSAVENMLRSTSLQPLVITKSQKTINDIIAYINNHLEETVTLTEIASHFYLSKDYLSRLFMRHTHTPISRYIAIQKISKAQEYLREGLTVSQVYEKMGFSSYAYFFKVFQKMTGISPSQYRAQNLHN